MKYLKTYEDTNKFEIGDIVYLNPNYNWLKYYPFVKIVATDNVRGNEKYYRVQVISEPDKGREFYTKYENVLRKATKTEIDLYYTTKKYNL